MVELLSESVLPRVERLVPEAIGLNTIVAIAGAGGVVGLVAASARGLPPAVRDDWARKGAVIGFWVGMALYASTWIDWLL